MLFPPSAVERPRHPDLPVGRHILAGVALRAQAQEG